MKKSLIIAVALLLALPVMSFAGDVTSRWDLTVGGFVKVDAGYNTQAADVSPSGLDQYYAQRNNAYGVQNPANSSGTFSMATGQTALNFLVKGPDAWGAKTSAFVQGAFTGQTNNDTVASKGTRYGTFTLNQAYMDFTWPTTKLTVGQTNQLWGFQPSYNILGYNDLAIEGKGSTVPQITVTQNFLKDFSASFGIQEPYKMTDQLGDANVLGETLNTTTVVNGVPTLSGNNTRVASQIPDFTGEIGYKSDSCGKIGPNELQFALGGFFGQDTVIYALPTTYRTDHVDRWAGAFKAFVPIIPEKNMDKTGSLSFSGSVFTGQNLSNWFLNARGTASLLAYDADLTGTGVNFKVPVTTGGWAQVTYYITDKVSMNGLYGYLWNDISNVYGLLNGYNVIHENRQYIANIIYDVTPAVRVGLEYTYIATNWAGPGGGSSDSANNIPVGGYAVTAPLGSKGDVQIARISFTYFF